MQPPGTSIEPHSCYPIRLWKVIKWNEQRRSADYCMACPGGCGKPTFGAKPKERPNRMKAKQGLQPFEAKRNMSSGEPLAVLSWSSDGPSVEMKMMLEQMMSFAGPFVCSLREKSCRLVVRWMQTEKRSQLPILRIGMTPSIHHYSSIHHLYIHHS